MTLRSFEPVLPDDFNARASALGRALMGAALFAFGCASSPAASSESGPDEPAFGTPVHVCGEESECASGEICVATRGAVCMPLPSPGGSCAHGCVLTEHCCNCTAFACLPAPADHCKSPPDCDCVQNALADGFLRGCPERGRDCTRTETGVNLLCVSVAYDEDPFAATVGVGGSAAALRTRGLAGGGG